MSQVTIYTTGSCPYCVMAKKFLQKQGVTDFEELRIDELPEQRETMQQRSGRRTVPQIFIGEHHIGGYTDLVALDQKDGLSPLLKG